MTAEGMAANRSGIAAPPRPTASKRGGRAICLVVRRSRKPGNLTARPLEMRISRKLIESFASLRLAKLVNSRRSRLPCAVRAWPRSEATSKLKGNLLRGCEVGWRWCAKCYGLAYLDPIPGPGRCAAGGQHDHRASGAYSVEF